MEITPSRGGLNRAHLQCRNLQEFLGGLSPGVLDRLYGHPATCLAVFRELPSLAKNWVMRMLFLEQPLPQAAVALWVKKEFSKAQEESTGLLSGLRIWHTQLLPGGLQGLILNPVFRQNLRIALLGGGKAWSDDTSQLGPDKHARDVPSLDKYAEERWEVRSRPLRASAVRPVPSSPRNPSLLTLFVSRWSCISWWAPPVQLSARTWLNSSARPGL